MIRRAWSRVFFAVCLACLVTNLNLALAQQEVDVESWGPSSGEVTWSLRDHALSWSTPRLQLHLDPWLVVRRVAGTPSSVSEPTDAWDSPWDNLRGATFGVTMDGVWLVEGSLEELQGIPSVNDAMWMDDSGHFPGWGRAKITLDGRVDVARARGRTQYVRSISKDDTLRIGMAYAPIQWGELLTPLTFSGTASSYPNASVVWSNAEDVELGITAARWTGTERGPAGGSTEALFRQSDAGWAHFRWTPLRAWEAGMLLGASRVRPWVSEAGADTAKQFEVQPFFSATASWRDPQKRWVVASEWSQTNGWGLTFRSALDKEGLGWAAGLARLTPLPASSDHMRNAGTPVAAALRPLGHESSAWRMELASVWRRGRFTSGARAISVADARIMEAWVGFEFQRTWPLHVTLGAEFWQVPPHPVLPSEGARLRVGLAHRFGMSPGTTTFGQP